MSHNLSVQKVCPIVLREKDGRQEILTFRHPQAGIQLVKGTIEKNEDPEVAVLRELAEESGISSVTAIEFIGIWDAEEENQRWHFYLCQVEENLAETWNFFADDDGGLDFSFFWFNLAEKPSNEWHPVFQRALKYIRDHISSKPGIREIC